MIINKNTGRIRCIRASFKGRLDEWKVMFCIVILNELWRKSVKKNLSFSTSDIWNMFFDLQKTIINIFSIFCLIHLLMFSNNPTHVSRFVTVRRYYEYLTNRNIKNYYSLSLQVKGHDLKIVKQANITSFNIATCFIIIALQ